MDAEIKRESQELVAAVEACAQSYESIDLNSRTYLDYALYLDELRQFLEGQFLVCSGRTRSNGKQSCLEPIYEIPFEPYRIQRVDLVGHSSGDNRHLFMEAEDGTTYEAFWAELMFTEADNSETYTNSQWLEHFIEPTGEHRRQVETIKRRIAGAGDASSAILEEFGRLENMLQASSLSGMLKKDTLVTTVEAIGEYVVGHNPTDERVDKAFGYLVMTPAQLNTDVLVTIFGTTLAQLGATDSAMRLVSCSRVVEPANQEVVFAAVAVALAKRGDQEAALTAYSSIIHMDTQAKTALHNFIVDQFHPAE